MPKPEQRQRHASRRASACSSAYALLVLGRSSRATGSTMKHDDERRPRRAPASTKHGGDRALGPLLGLGARDREALAGGATIVDAVELGRPRGLLLELQLGGQVSSVDLVGLVVGASGSTAAALASLMTSLRSTGSISMIAPMPTTQMTRPSGTGPSRPMPSCRPGPLVALLRLDVGDDRLLLARGQLVVAEHRHVLRAGQHRGRRSPCRWRRSAAARTCPADSAPPWPVKLWQDAQLSRNSSPPSARSGVVAAQVAGRDLRAAADGLDVGRQLLDLRRRELRLLARRSGRPAGPPASGRWRPGSRRRPRRRRSATGPRSCTPCRFAPWQVMQLVS